MNKVEPRAPHETTKLARAAGLRELGTPRLEDVNKRRSQLWVLSLVIGLAIPGVLVALAFDVLPAQVSGLLDLRTVQLSLVALLVALFGYIVEREVALRRLTRLLFEERALTDALVSRVHELDLLFKAARAMNSTLALRPVLDMILDSAYELLRAGAGSIALVAADDAGELEVVAVRGAEKAQPGERSPAQSWLVSDGREAMLVMDTSTAAGAARPVGSELVVPLQHRDQLVGLLHLTASPEHAFTEFHLRSVAVFAETASAAISNARLHESMQATVEALCELDRMKDDFLAMLTHELRSPLTGIIGCLATIERGLGTLSTEQVRELVAMARRQGWRLDRLVDDLLETAGMQQGGTQLCPAVVDARSPVTRAVRAMAPQTGDRYIDVQLPDEPLLCSLDSEAVTRILTNLIGNALKHTPAGTRVTVAMAPWQDGMAVTVSDDGPGIPRAEQERIFERFQRGTASAGTDGLGLGLHIVKTLAEAHGGTVRLVDRGAGACFEVRLAAIAVQETPSLTV